MDLPKRKPLNKRQREALYNKYNGHCAYCGCELRYEDMQADHIESVYRTEVKRWNGRESLSDKELNAIENFMPACRSCNFYKGVYTIDTFRNNLKIMLWQNLKCNFNYKMALKYGLITENEKEIKFYFEICEEGDNGEQIRLWCLYR